LNWRVIVWKERYGHGKRLEITYGYKKGITYRLHVKDITYHIITSKKVWLNKLIYILLGENKFIYH